MLRKSWTSFASVEAALELWASALGGAKLRMQPLFGQERSAVNAGLFLDVLLGAERRKTGWIRAEAAGDPGPWRQKALLGRDRWDADALRDLVRECVVEQLAGNDAVLVIDETGFLKQGKASCGVARQYTGSAGKIMNCQIGMFATCVSRHGHAFIDRACLENSYDSAPSCSCARSCLWQNWQSACQHNLIGCGRALVWRPTQRGRWCFPEKLPICHGEAPELPEAVIIGDHGDRGGRGIGQSQCPPGLVHPAQPEISVRTDAQMMQAVIAQCTLSNADCGAYLCHIKWFVRRLTHGPFEPSHDRRALMARGMICDCSLPCKTVNHGAYRRILDRPGDLGVRENVRRRCGKMAGCPVQVPQPRHDVIW
jgi:hypothetical protein